MVYLRWNELRTQLGLNGDGIVPRAQAEQLVALDAAVESILQEARQFLADARLQGQRIRDEAVAGADAIRAQAEEECRSARESAYAQGSIEAAKTWLDKAAGPQREGHALFSRHRETLGKIVVNTVRQLVRSAPAGDFFEAAMSALDREAEEARWMVLYVHPGEVQEASRMLETFRGRWPDGMSVRIEPQASFEPRSCRVETDLGYIDSSLEIQLAVFAARLGSGAIAGLPESRTC